MYGDLTPYGDPGWYQGWNSPYYNESHRRFRAALRVDLEKNWRPHIEDWENAKTLPKGMLNLYHLDYTYCRLEMYIKAYEAGWLPAFIGTPWPTEYAGTKIIGGVRPEEFDAFHELILQDELARLGAAGVTGALFGGLSIGLPPVMLFASQYLKEKVLF